MRITLGILLAGALVFSPPVSPGQNEKIVPVVNRDYLPALLELIGAAQKSIDFIQLEFHYDHQVKKVQDALREAVGRGVAVRGLIEDKISFNRKSEEYLNRFGIETRLDTPRKQLHNKLFVVDRRRVLLGSTNLSANSMDNNNETNVLVESPAVGEFFERYFEQLWKNSEAEPVLEEVEIPGAATVVNRGHFPVLEKMIAGAEQRVWVMVYGMSYSRSYPDSKANALIDSLIRAAGRGLDVRVVLDLSDYNQGLNRLNRETAELLEKGGVDVRFDREDVTTHAKLVLADRTALVGSANWGYQALEVRNESSLLITDPAAVAFFSDYFTEIWNGRIYPPPTPVPGGPAATPSPAPAPEPSPSCPGK